MPGIISNNMALLKVADKLVRQGDLQAALDAILKARESEPTNRYVDAYEERVRALIAAQSAPAETSGSDTGAATGNADGPAAPYSRLGEIVALLDHANTAMARGDFPEALEYIGKARQLDPDDQDICALGDQIRYACEGASPNQAEAIVDFDVVLSTLEAYSSEAMELAGSGDYEEALHLVAKGFMLDPSNEQLHEAAAAAGLRPGQWQPFLVKQDPSLAIVEQEQEADCDLIVIGKHGAGVVEEFLLGSVTKHVLAESAGDVLVSTPRSA